ncbi:MAG TPA: hypothetical protein VN625_10895 [Desulfuromonadaceae bacterium]|nr:hypothetical protein [Desulfuromonadaceae bacterium]
MAERIHLGTSIKPEGALGYTLVVESPTNFYVEQSLGAQPTRQDEDVKVIPVAEFGRYVINGSALGSLVADTFRAKYSQNDTRKSPYTVTHRVF